MKRALGNFVVLAVLIAMQTSHTSSQQYLCPTVNVECVSAAPCCHSPFEFAVHTSAPPGTITYRWTISAGKIVAGQGTTTIKVVSKPFEVVTATVEIFGPDPKCPRVASISQTICEPVPRARLFDQYAHVSSVNAKARLDRFANKLRNEPSVQAYIFIYGGPSRRAEAKSYLVDRGIEADRVVIVHRKSKRNKSMTKLYVVPLGADAPRG